MKRFYFLIPLAAGCLVALLLGAGDPDTAYFPNINVATNVTIGGVLTVGPTNVIDELALKAPLASPALTGTPTINGNNIPTNWVDSGTSDSTLAGTATAGAYDYAAPATLTPVDAGTVIDFGAAVRTASCTLTGAASFTFSGLTGTTVRNYNLQLQNSQATNCPFTFPTGTRLMGILGYQSASKGGRMSIEYWPGVSTNVFYIEAQ